MLCDMGSWASRQESSDITPIIYFLVRCQLLKLSYNFEGILSKPNVKIALEKLQFADNWWNRSYTEGSKGEKNK